MPLPLLPIAIQLASLVGPKVIEWVAGESAGEVAQEVVDIAGKVTGKADPEESLKAIQQDATLRAEFRKSVREHEERLEQMFLDDRQDARARDVRLRELGAVNKRADVMVALAFASLVTIVLVVWHLHAQMPPELLGFFSTVTGYLLKMLGDAFAFEFGSSRGSKNKDVMLARQADR